MLTQTAIKSHLGLVQPAGTLVSLTDSWDSGGGHWITKSRLNLTHKGNSVVVNAVFEKHYLPNIPHGIQEFIFAASHSATADFFDKEISEKVDGYIKTLQCNTPHLLTDYEGHEDGTTWKIWARKYGKPNELVATINLRFVTNEAIELARSIDIEYRGRNFRYQRYSDGVESVIEVIQMPDGSEITVPANNDEAQAVQTIKEANEVNTHSQVEIAIAESEKVELNGGSALEADDKFDEVMAVGVGATTSPVARNIQWVMDELDDRNIDHFEMWEFLERIPGLLDDREALEAAVIERFGIHKRVKLNGKTYRYQRYDNYRMVTKVCHLCLDWSVDDEEKQMVINHIESFNSKVDLSWLNDTEEYPVFLFDAVDMHDLTSDQLDELIDEANSFTDKTRLLEDDPIKVMTRLLDVSKGAWSLVPKQIEVNFPDSCRFVRGQVIAQRGGVAQISEHEFRVKSCKGNGFYNVIEGRFDSARCTSWHCDCRDRPVNEGCKHIWAVLHTEALSDYFDNERYQIPKWAKTEELSRWPYVEYQL